MIQNFYYPILKKIFYVLWIQNEVERWERREELYFDNMYSNNGLFT